MSDKVREDRLRRMAQRRGFRIVKSRRRDPRANDYGGRMIVDARTNAVVAGGHPYAYNLTINEVEEYLNDGDQ